MSYGLKNEFHHFVTFFFTDFYNHILFQKFFCRNIFFATIL